MTKERKKRVKIDMETQEYIDGLSHIYPQSEDKSPMMQNTIVHDLGNVEVQTDNRSWFARLFGRWFR